MVALHKVATHLKVPMSKLVNNDVILLQPDDSVAVALKPLRAGCTVSVAGRQLEVLEEVPRGHKVAVRAVEQGQPVLKYGQMIGFATQPILPGQWVHEHNLSARRFERRAELATDCPPDPVAEETLFFDGIERADGRVGTRNYIALISTVNCSASVCRAVADRIKRDGLARYPNVDGVFAATHRGGCGIGYGGLEHSQLSRTLAGFAAHPNVADCVLVGLGCETTHPDYVCQCAPLGASRCCKRPKTLSIQACGGTTAAIDQLARMVAEMLPACNDVRRSRQPASKLVVGIECGGSDSNSGITANPVAGAASDLLVAQGGTSVVGETPELYGAEHLLARRAKRPEVARKLLERIRWWERYAEFFGAAINDNPSVGNKSSGLTTIYEKSLGAVAKAGTAPLSHVIEYAEPVPGPGLVFMDTPGFDAVSVTGLVAGGATVIVFTTGLGSCSGCKPSPVIKVASNTELYERLSGDMDFNAGVVLDGVPVEQAGRDLFKLILEVASGRRTCSERLDLGEEEFAPWSVGPVF